jgi:hypothetical protein
MQKLPRLTLLLWLVVGGVGLVRWSGRDLRGADESAAKPAAETSPDSASQDPESSPEALALLHEARQRLFTHSSVRASIREYVQLGDHSFEAVGAYVAGPFNPLPQLRLEYQVRVGNTVGTLLEVCDGQILRTQKSLKRLDHPANTGSPRNQEEDPTAPLTTITRRDVRKILDAVHRYGPNPETILQAELGIGGLPALLTSMERVMVFDSVREEPLQGRPCHVLQATWKPSYLKEIASQFQIFGRNVQSYLPAFTRVHLDAQTLFPLRITYWPTPAESGPARPPLLTLEFTDVHLNEPVNPVLFEFPASEVDESDITEEFIEAIKAAAAAPATQPIAPPTSAGSPGN